MSLQATNITMMESPTSGAGNGPGADEKRQAAELGVGFDGRYYRYRDYRYDHLADALNYARLERAKLGKVPAGGQPQWLEPVQPTDEERKLMAQYAITFDGRFFVYDGYRYDRCIDAANYAKLKKSPVKP